VVLWTIESRASELISAPVPETPLGILARLHALLLYQIMRMLDGDIVARASAECAIPALESAAFSLFGMIRFDDGSAGSLPEGGEVVSDQDSLPILPETDPNFWQDWLFQESGRRSLVLTFFFIQAQEILTGRRNPGICDYNLSLCRSWTMSSHLWSAQNPVDFAIAWREKRQFTIMGGSFAHVLRDAEPEDVDKFGRMMMVSVLGIDEASMWFYRKGGVLK